MIIEHLYIKNLRIFKEINIYPNKQYNLITGLNGSGKTTILESIYLLARSRSFRTISSKNLIRKNEPELVIQANITNDKNLISRIGIKKTIKKTEVHINANRQNKVSEQAKQLPLGIITPNSYKLISEGPNYRRKFLNWGVFHVEHGYASLINTYNKILTQRNYSLRHQYKYQNVWDKQLAFYGTEIDKIRSRYINQFKQIFFTLSEDYPDLLDIEFSYKRGWSDSRDLMEVLRNNNVEDQKYTYYGPHRADISIFMNGSSAIEVLSHGQIKILSILMILTQLLITKNTLIENPLLLLDDFHYELDNLNLKKIMQTINHLNLQTFISTIDDEIFNLTGLNARVFHVEHGEIR